MESGAGITFVGDWMRVAVQKSRVSVTQQGNVLWIARLMAPALDACGISTAVVMPSSDAAEFAVQLDDAAILQAFLAAPSETWAKAYDGPAQSRWFAALYDAIPVANLIVGFEIPPFMKREFASRGMEYLSLHVHPVRFLQDFIFSAYTNSPALAFTMASISCDFDEVARQVSRFSARLARLDPVQAHLPDGIPILLGQTSVDSSLITNGRFMRLPDYAGPLAALLDGYTEVAFLKHPLADWRMADVHFLTREMGKTMIGISGNSYAHVMSPARLGPIATISSSLGVEAQLFGHECHFLLSDPRDKFAVAELDNSQRVQLDHRVFTPPFWHEIMARSGQGVAALHSSFPFGPDYVRGTLQDTSLEGLEGAGSLPSMAKLIVPGPGLSPARLNEIAGRIAGAGLHDQRQAIERAADHHITLQVSPAPLAADRDWLWDSTVGLPEQYLHGFHPVEEYGVWSDEATCDIIIPLDDAPELELEFEADLSFFSGILDRNPALLICVDGQPVSALIQIGTAQEIHRLSWTAPVAAGAVHCTVQIECSHSARPSDLGMNDDNRSLGFMLHRLFVRARPALQAGNLGKFRVWGLAKGPVELVEP